MTVPSRVESAALLLSLDPPPWHMRHSRAVAEVAAWLAARVRGVSGRAAPDRRLVETAALLHDADKLPGVRPHVAGLPHGVGTAAWLAGLGYPELGPPVAAHPVTCLVDGEWFDRWLEAAGADELILAYADKRAGQRLEPLAARLAEWERRFPPRENPDDPAAWSRQTLDAVRERCLRLEAEVCRRAGVTPGDVRRLGWTGPALRRAAGGRGEA